MDEKSNANLGKVILFAPKSNSIYIKSNAFKKKKQSRNKNYDCDICAYSTTIISNYKKHLKSKKHLKLIVAQCSPLLAQKNEKTLVKNEPTNQKNEPTNQKNEPTNQKNEPTNQNEPNIYKCDICSIEIKHRSSYSRHMKKHKENYARAEEKIIKLEKKLNAIETTHEKEMLTQELGYCKKIIKTREHYKEKGGMGHHNTINSNNTNNISINVFLNEKCKNAMNLTDFVNQIKVQLEDVMYTHQHGAEKGITNILVKQLEDVPITERPIHCADRSRKKFYVKDDDIWKKTIPSKEEDGEKGPIERCIRNLKSKQHLVMETKWKEENPDHNVNPEKTDEYLDIENKIWKGCAKGESWSDYMKTMEKDIAEWSLPTLKEEMKEELDDK
jgi:hypothetical protein